MIRPERCFVLNGSFIIEHLRILLDRERIGTVENFTYSSLHIRFRSRLTYSNYSSVQDCRSSLIPTRTISLSSHSHSHALPCWWPFASLPPLARCTDKTLLHPPELYSFKTSSIYQQNGLEEPVDFTQTIQRLFHRRLSRRWC